MKLLITGGAGFIGSHLSRECLKNGYEVCIIDDFSTGQRSNIEDLSKNQNFKIVEGSIFDEELVLKHVKPVDIVFHLAAAVGVKLIVSKTSETIKTIDGLILDFVI